MNHCAEPQDYGSWSAGQRRGYTGIGEQLVELISGLHGARGTGEGLHLQQQFGVFTRFQA